MPERNTIVSASAPEILAKLRLARTAGVGPLTYQRLMARHGSAAEALDALPALARAGGRQAMTLHSLAQAERELADVQRLGGRMIFLGDDAYPPLLTLLPDPPPLLAVPK